MIPCYVSGKGMRATHRTRNFKVLVIQELESSGLGYDTRYRYYRSQYPEFDMDQLARIICDPVELYDKDWPSYLAARGGAKNQEQALAAFILERDARFRDEAEAAIYCYDEAGFGSGVNAMRFIRDGKPILGFYHADASERAVNLTNVLQLQLEFPSLITLVSYRSLEEILDPLAEWLRGIRQPKIM